MADELKGALEVLSRTESSIEARLVLSEGMSVFDGHFPCLAILPGVVQLNLVETLAAEWAGRPLRIASIPQMKFTVPLRPGDALLVKLAFKPAEDGNGCVLRLRNVSREPLAGTLSLPALKADIPLCLRPQQNLTLRSSAIWRESDFIET